MKDSIKGYPNLICLAFITILSQISCTKKTIVDQPPEQKEELLSYTKQILTLNDTKTTSKDLERTLRHVSGNFVYKSENGDKFAFYSGHADWTLGNTVDAVPPIASQIFKKVDGKWAHFKEDFDASFRGARNYKIVENRIVIGEGNEIGSDPREWKGNILFGKIQSNGNINWQIVNKQNERGFFHGVTMGDLNNDELLDFGGTPGINHSRLNIFVQEFDGVFKKSDDLININSFYHYTPFTLEYADLFGDKRNEIIVADYGGGNVVDSDDHEIGIYTYDTRTQKFELIFKDNYPNAYTWGLGATSIKVFDANRDGIKDIAVAREDLVKNGFEVWLGQPNQTYKYSFSSPTWNDKEMQFREFVILDANNDGLDDIILVPFHFGTLFRNNPCQLGEDPRSCSGIKLNHLIWLNKGDGKFEHYNKDPLVLKDVTVNFLIPYKEGNSLYFLGTYNDNPNLKIFEFYDIKLNLK